MAADGPNDQGVESAHALARKLDTIGWGVFLIWIGIAFLADAGWEWDFSV